MVLVLHNLQQIVELLEVEGLDVGLEARVSTTGLMKVHHRSSSYSRSAL